jgi:phenylacetate-coenzyme A ligase PaaK-like adenylate-forming protein
MDFFPLRSVPGVAWPPVPIPEFSQVWAAYQELDRTQWLSAGEQEELQLRQLRALLLHCFHQVPYYRRLLSEAGLGARPIESLAEFRPLPLLTRQLYQTHFDDLRARNLPAGMVAANSLATSGTNGVSIKVLQTNRVSLWWSAFYLRDLEWCGLDPRRRLAAIRFLRSSGKDVPGGREGLVIPCWNAALAPLLETGPSYGLDIRQDPRKQLEWLRKIDPDYLLSMPSNLEFLAGLVGESGQRIPALQAIQAIGETLTEASARRIEAGFGVPVKNCYSATEAGYLASACPRGHGLHVHAENVLVEVLDDDNRPCRPGQTGRLVFTTLHNFLTPFLRYDILDDVTLASGPCPCGRGLPLLTHVSGRRHPLLYLPDGRRKIATGVTMEFRKVGGYHQLQFVQRAADHVILRLVPDRNWTPDHAERLRRTVRQEFGAPIRVDVETKDCLERSPGGKLKRFVIEMEEGISPS